MATIRRTPASVIAASRFSVATTVPAYWAYMSPALAAARCSTASTPATASASPLRRRRSACTKSKFAPGLPAVLRHVAGGAHHRAHRMPAPQRFGHDVTAEESVRACHQQLHKICFYRVKARHLRRRRVGARSSRRIHQPAGAVHVVERHRRLAAGRQGRIGPVQERPQPLVRRLLHHLIAEAAEAGPTSRRR